MTIEPDGSQCATSGGSTSELVVRFERERWTLRPGDTFSFGRAADLDLDTNVDLPEVVGRFEHVDGRWRVVDLTDAIVLVVAHRIRPVSAVVVPGGVGVLAAGPTSVRFSAGRADYELVVEVDDAEVIDLRVPVTLNREQRELLAVLSESKLRRPDDPIDLPSNADAAERLGWTITKLNRKLDNLCTKFDKLGVPGLRGSARRLASDRRRRLVDHVVRSGIVTEEDLELIAGR